MSTSALAAMTPAESPVSVLDRWIFPLMAAFFVLTALVGFIPASLEKVAAVQAGMRPPFPAILHVHAVLMGGWLLLLLAQTLLVATGNTRYHRKLGLAAVALVPAMIVAACLLVPAMFRQVWQLTESAPPGMDRAAVEQTVALVSNIILPQIRTGILFPVFVGWALLLRNRDPETHKRLMVLATVIPLAAAMDRIAWLPTSLPSSPLSMDLYTLLWILPLFAWDLFRSGSIQRAYMIWFAVNLPFAITMHLLWGSPWWLAAAPGLMGLD